MDILICGGDPSVALDLCGLVFEQGHRLCGTSTSPEGCIEKAARARPDLVLVDVEYGRTGHRVVETLAQLGVPLIIIAGDVGQVPLTCSAQAVIEKPIRKPRLVSAIAEVERSGRGLASAH